MKKYVAKMAMMIMAALFLGGMVLILTATSVGLKKGEDAIRRNGGSMETDKYYRIIETSTQDYRTAGIVMGAVGGLGMVCMVRAVYKELE